MSLLPLAILAAVALTSLLSGIVGMAGGMILMAVLAAFYSIPVAMLLHGVSQAAANGSRVWFLRRHVRKRVLAPYLAGSAVSFAMFALLRIVPDRALVLLLIGAIPWLALIFPARMALDMERPLPAAAAGLTVTAAQLLAGASGPLLDLFYQRSRLTRHQVVATKAVTQTLGHVVKLAYYGSILLVTERMPETPPEAPPWLFLLVVPTAIAGTWLGTRALSRLDDRHFHRLSGWIILGLGAACMLAGGFDLLRG